MKKQVQVATAEEVAGFPTTDAGMKAAGMNRSARMAMRAQLRRGATKVKALEEARSAAMRHRS